MNLYDLRIAAGLSHEDLGKAAGVHADTIRDLENGNTRPHTKTAHKLVVFFTDKLGREVLASELFPRDDERAAA
jgi:DNA-binding XRE family transcriptional regulator